LAAGSATSATVVTSLRSSDTVPLSAPPASADGPFAPLSPTDITLTHGGQGTSTITISTTSKTPSGSYQITVSGASGSLSRSAFITVIVDPDFSISAGPVTPANFVAGSSATTTVTLGSIGLAGSVSLTGTVSGSPIGLLVSFVPSSVTLSAGSVTLLAHTLSTTLS